MSKPIHVTDQSFKQDVLESAIPVLVDFWAPWCGPCKYIAPVIDELAAEYDGKVKIVKLNTDENPGTSKNYNISGIPTLGIFINGQMADHIVGAQPKPFIVDKLNYYMQGVSVKN